MSISPVWVLPETNGMGFTSKERCGNAGDKPRGSGKAILAGGESLSLYPGSTNYWLIDLTLQVISFSVSSFPFLGAFKD